MKHLLFKSNLLQWVHSFVSVIENVRAWYAAVLENIKQHANKFNIGLCLN